MTTAAPPGSVLGLREQVRGDNIGLGRVVDNDRDLGRTREGIDPDEPRDLTLRLRDVGIAGPTMTSTAGIDSVPYANAAIACAPPTGCTASTPASAAAASVTVGT